MNIDVMPPTLSFFCRFITTYDFLLRMDIPDNIFIFGSCHIDNIHNRHKWHMVNWPTGAMLLWKLHLVGLTLVATERWSAERARAWTEEWRLGVSWRSCRSWWTRYSNEDRRFYWYFIPSNFFRFPPGSLVRTGKVGCFWDMPSE